MRAGWRPVMLGDMGWVRVARQRWTLLLDSWEDYALQSRNTELSMATTLTVKGQVTIPKHIRDAVGLTPGTRVEFVIDDRGNVVIEKADRVRATDIQDRFSAAIGKATIPWRSDELMRLLRGEDWMQGDT